MRFRLSKYEIGALISVFILVLSCGIASCFIPKEVSPEPQLRSHIRCVLDLQDAPGRRRSLIVGYNYFLLTEYAKSNGQTIDIKVTRQDKSYTDSLKAGVVDLVAVPMHRMQTQGVLHTQSIDSVSVWLLREDDKHNMKDIKRWLAEWKKNPKHDSTKDIFLKRFNPRKSRPRATISPYDSLIRANADSLGWDWRMLAAVIWQESHFHIEARSNRGASGLMQMMPTAATKYGVSDPLDPEQNIRAGSMMLDRLYKRYLEVTDSSEESFKFALAAYNAGIGRIKSLIDYAQHNGRSYNSWDSLRLLIPEMNDALERDSTFNYMVIKGNETVKYVDNVFSTYNEFKRICPQ